MKQRKTALLLVLTMLVCMFTACANDGDTTPNTDPSSDQTETSSQNQLQTLKQKLVLKKSR